MVDKKAEAGWIRADYAYHHYASYLISKGTNRLSLSFTDFVYVKNFKGGNTVVGEPPASFTEKVVHYEQALRRAAATVSFRKPLQELDDQEYQEAVEVIVAFAGLPTRPDAGIYGFGVSLATALLHFFFPHLVPILDRRGLNGARIPGITVKQGQITNFMQVYPDLIAYFRKELRTDPKATMRSLDRKLFIQPLGPEFD